MVGIGKAHFYGGTRRGGKAAKGSGPLHEVKLEAFCIDRTEVTVAAYKECVDAGKCTLKLDRQEEIAARTCNRLLPEKMAYPINCVTKEDATAYCAFREGRLPSADEWQLAAGRMEGREYPWGDATPNAKTANLRGTDDETYLYDSAEFWKPMYAGKDGWEHTATVASFPNDRSPFDVLDMGGNVSEWLLGEDAVYHVPQAAGGDYAMLAPTRQVTSLFGSHGPSIGFRCLLGQ